MTVFVVNLLLKDYQPADTHLSFKHKTKVLDFVGTLVSAHVLSDPRSRMSQQQIMLGESAYQTTIRAGWIDCLDCSSEVEQRQQYEDSGSLLAAKYPICLPPQHHD